MQNYKLFTAALVTILTICCHFSANGQAPGTGLKGEIPTPLITTNPDLKTLSSNSIPPAGATILWNGKDLSGWKPYATNSDFDLSKFWSVQDGALRLSGKPFGYIRTENTYSNYHLHVEWRWPVTNGNSGAFVHFNGKDAIWPLCVECQLKSGVVGEVVSLGNLEGLGSIDMLAPVLTGRKRSKVTTSHENPRGEWNSLDTYCRGDNITVDVNGHRKNSVDGVSVTSGGIGLQSEGQPIEFRNIWLSPL